MEQHARPSARAVFDHAVEIPLPAERQAYLCEACGDDADLRQKVDALLRAYQEAGSFLESSAADPEFGTQTVDPANVPLREGPGSLIGRYKLLQQIGEGGMGVVFLAEQTHPVRRQVALKVIKAGMDTRQVVARFESERQALAMMDHPSIAKVLDAGATEAGRPYFVMELVKGVPITKYCDEHRVEPRQRLELFMHVCHAVQHAHQKGIIHRDIKPTNVLVAQYDGKPVPKVIDFGVAKATGHKLTDRTMFTGFGDVIGTLEYMSPEQAEVNQLDVDTRSDIYSLGVLLYELLTGTTPLEHKRVMKAGLLEMLRVVREEEPPMPSMRLTASDKLASISASRGLEPKKLSGLVKGELDWIVMKALEKDRARRYETANGFVRDVERYLADEPVQACPPSATYRFRKFARRNKRALTAASALFAMLLVLVVALAVSNVAISRERNQKAAAFIEVEAQRLRAEGNLRKARVAIRDVLTAPATGAGQWSELPQAMRWKFIEGATKYYESLVQSGDPNPSARYETAVAYRSLSHLVGSTSGDSERAERLARDAIRILEGLSAEYPSVLEYRHQLAWSHFVLGHALKAAGKHADAEADFQKSVDGYELLLRQKPDSSVYRAELLNNCRYVAELMIQRRELTQAERVLRRALQVYGDGTGFGNQTTIAADAAQIRAALITVLVKTGGLAEVADMYARRAEANPASATNWYYAAPLYLAAGDVEAYRRACRTILDRSATTTDPQVAETTAKTCCLAPDAVGDFVLVRQLADRAVTGNEQHVYHRLFVLTQALVGYRAGEYANAVDAVGRFSPNPEGAHWDASALAVLAMAQSRLARPGEARTALQVANTILEQKMPDADEGRQFDSGDWHDWLHAQILCREAERVLTGPATQTGKH